MFTATEVPSSVQLSAPEKSSSNVNVLGVNQYRLALSFSTRIELSWTSVGLVVM